MSAAFAYVTRDEMFSAGHRLYSEHLSEEENRNLYGLCMNPNGHGHNYKVEITLKAPINPKTGMTIKFALIKEHLTEVIRIVDHKNLNKDVEFFKDKITTTENVALFFWESLKVRLPRDIQLHEVKISSTDKNHVYFRGEYV